MEGLLYSRVFSRVDVSAHAIERTSSNRYREGLYRREWKERSLIEEFFRQLFSREPLSDTRQLSVEA